MKMTTFRGKRTSGANAQKVKSTQSFYFFHKMNKKIVIFSYKKEG